MLVNPVLKLDTQLAVKTNAKYSCVFSKIKKEGSKDTRLPENEIIIFDNFSDNPDKFTTPLSIPAVAHATITAKELRAVNSNPFINSPQPYRTGADFYF